MGFKVVPASRLKEKYVPHITYIISSNHMSWNIDDILFQRGCFILSDRSSVVSWEML